MDGVSLATKDSETVDALFIDWEISGGVETIMLILLDLDTNTWEVVRLEPDDVEFPLGDGDETLKDGEDTREELVVRIDSRFDKIELVEPTFTGEEDKAVGLLAEVSDSEELNFLVVLVFDTAETTEERTRLENDIDFGTETEAGFWVLVVFAVEVKSLEEDVNVCDTDVKEDFIEELDIVFTDIVDVLLPFPDQFFNSYTCI
ncbi:hypothetical protein EYC84_010121 [Monilinia fructicola]|uniref:Uncharacterized protein n=1 Tax=Monilinia fructicola TaxID=38448 RepID=A0A5M9JE53_MONFR|nr:hypothetical protein EYC84_010121 [Monilinia fructicola]